MRKKGKADRKGSAKQVPANSPKDERRQQKEPKEQDERVAVRTGLWQIEQGGRGRTLAILFCAGRKTDGFGQFFVEKAVAEKKAFSCPYCKEEHEISIYSMRLRKALSQSSQTVSPDTSIVRPLFANEIRWLRNRSAWVSPLSMAAQARLGRLFLSYGHKVS
ncbi:MAG TPA: hypothetical protein VGL03_10100 [Thermoanaerobaculia bacterium]|jgi:hypothetical protein